MIGPLPIIRTECMDESLGIIYLFVLFTFYIGCNRFYEAAQRLRYPHEHYFFCIRHHVLYKKLITVLIIETVVATSCYFKSYKKYFGKGALNPSQR